MTVLDGLRAVRALLNDPARWTQGSFFRDGACCLVGACSRIGKASIDVNGMVEELWPGTLVPGEPICGARKHPRSQILLWNDAPGRTHAEVLNLLDTTIARLEGEG